MKGFPEGTLHGGGRAEGGCGAPHSQDGAWCPVLLQEDAWEEAFLSCGFAHRQQHEAPGPSPAVCVEGGGAQETPGPGRTRQREELVPAVLILMSLSRSGCTTPQAFSGTGPRLGTNRSLSILNDQRHLVQTKADQVSLALTYQ